MRSLSASSKPWSQGRQILRAQLQRSCGRVGDAKFWATREKGKSSCLPLCAESFQLLGFALGVGLCSQPGGRKPRWPPRCRSNGDLEEIVVTARMRDETVQCVPITMNVFTAETIKAAGIEKPRTSLRWSRT